MKSLFLSLLLLVAFWSQDAHALKVNQYLSGSWFNPQQNGHGFSVEIISDTQAVFYWFVYNPDGSPTFLITVASIQGDTLEGTTFYNSGMIWGEFNPADLSEQVWGTINIQFIDCNHATMTYASSHEISDIPSGEGTIELTRLLSIDQMQCNENLNAGIYEGNFVDQDTDELTTGTILLSSSGEVVAFSFGDSVSFGGYSVSSGGNLNSGGVTHSVNPEEDYVEPYDASGKVKPDYRMIFNYQVENQGGGQANTYSISSLYRRGIDLESIAGEWATQDLAGDGQWSTIILQDGSFDATDESGCVYDGQITIPDTAFNLFEVTLEVSDCNDEDDDGDYSGLGYQLDGFLLGDGRVIRIFAGNLESAVLIQLSR